MKIQITHSCLNGKKIESGDHLPHPQLRLKKGKAFSYDFPKGVKLILDNKSIGRYKAFSVKVIPHAIQVIVGFSN